MYAIIETGGKQYMTKVGDTLYVEKLTANEGEEITIKAVAISKDGKEEESWKIRLCKKHILDLTKECIRRGKVEVEVTD